MCAKACSECSEVGSSEEEVSVDGYVYVSSVKALHEQNKHKNIEFAAKLFYLPARIKMKVN